MAYSLPRPGTLHAASRPPLQQNQSQKLSCTEKTATRLPSTVSSAMRLGVASTRADNPAPGPCRTLHSCCHSSHHVATAIPASLHHATVLIPHIPCTGVLHSVSGCVRWSRHVSRHPCTICTAGAPAGAHRPLPRSVTGAGCSGITSARGTVGSGARRNPTTILPSSFSTLK